MSRELPKEFLERMQKLPGLNFGEFLKSYDEPPFKGLRFSKKARQETIDRLIDEWDLKKIPWTEKGYYYSSDLRPGLSPYHDAGVYYIQEPSAMAVAEAAGIQPSDRVLDLCAAPGGKTTRACELAGFVLSNEIVPQRAKILSSNVERMGAGNVIVTSASPDRLASSVGSMFDIVIADVPCSGEGMMRRDETAVNEWSTENVENCILRQKEILSSADGCLREGGKLVYSTCTYEPGENELQIRDFLITHPEYILKTEKTFYPHESGGEGQYYAVLTKGTAESFRSFEDAATEMRLLEKMLTASGIHILRSGIMKGEYKTDKRKDKIYIPSHAEVMASSYEKNPFANAALIEREETAISYLKGNQLSEDRDGILWKGEQDGYLGVYFDGYPLGLGKKTGNILKNHLPKGLRRF